MLAEVDWGDSLWGAARRHRVTDAIQPARTCVLVHRSANRTLSAINPHPHTHTHATHAPTTLIDVVVFVSIL